MSEPRTSPGPRLSSRSVTASSDLHRSTRSFRLRMTSVTSSLTPLMTSNSCNASSKRTCVTAAPGIDESNVRRRLLPRVWPKPGSSGAIVKRCRLPSGSPASISGRWMISMKSLLVLGSLGTSRKTSGLLGVQLDDELLAHGNVDLLAQRKVTHGRLEVADLDLEPLRNGAVERVDVVTNNDHLARLLAQRDDLALLERVRRDGHALAV